MSVAIRTCAEHGRHRHAAPRPHPPPVVVVVVGAGHARDALSSPHASAGLARAPANPPAPVGAGHARDALPTDPARDALALANNTFVIGDSPETQQPRRQGPPRHQHPEGNVWFNLRNTRLDVFDPWVDAAEAQHEYGLIPIAAPQQGVYDAIVLAVGHDQFRALGGQGVRAFGKADASVVYGVKYVLPRDAVDGRL